MSMNLGTYALISALAVGGAVAQHQYSQPAGPPQPDTKQQQASPVPNGYSSTPTGSTAVVDCNTLMSHHQQMMTDLDNLDQQLDAQVSQMRDAKSDRAKLEATMGVVDTLVTQRKQQREQMMRMEHETWQFMLANKDASTSCPQLTQWLQQGATMNTDDSSPMQGGPDDGQLNNDNSTTTPDSSMPNNNGNGQR